MKLIIDQDEYTGKNHRGMYISGKDTEQEKIEKIAEKLQKTGVVTSWYGNDNEDDEYSAHMSITIEEIENTYGQLTKKEYEKELRSEYKKAKK